MARGRGGPGTRRQGPFSCPPPSGCQAEPCPAFPQMAHSSLTRSCTVRLLPATQSREPCPVEGGGWESWCLPRWAGHCHRGSGRTPGAWCRVGRSVPAGAAVPRYRGGKVRGRGGVQWGHRARSGSFSPADGTSVRGAVWPGPEGGCCRECEVRGHGYLPVSQVTGPWLPACHAPRRGSRLLTGQGVWGCPRHTSFFFKM